MSSFQPRLSLSGNANTDCVINSNLTSNTEDGVTVSKAYHLFNSTGRSGENNPIDFPRVSNGTVAGLGYQKSADNSGVALMLSKDVDDAGTTVAVSDGFYVALQANVVGTGGVLHVTMPDVPTSNSGLNDGDLYFNSGVLTKYSSGPPM